MNTTIRHTILAAISESWTGEPIPHPFENEFARGQFEVAVHLLGYGGESEMEYAILDLYADAQDVHENHSL